VMSRDAAIDEDTRSTKFFWIRGCKDLLISVAICRWDGLKSVALPRYFSLGQHLSFFRLLAVTCRPIMSPGGWPFLFLLWFFFLFADTIVLVVARSNKCTTSRNEALVPLMATQINRVVIKVDCEVCSTAPQRMFRSPDTNVDDELNCQLHKALQVLLHFCTKTVYSPAIAVRVKATRSSTASQRTFPSLKQR
jgi:hypothetical protein